MIEEFEQKEKQTRHLLRMGIVMILLLIALILASARIHTFKILGNAHYSEQEVVDMIFSGPWDTNSFYQFIKDKTQPHKQLPFVEKYQIHWTGPLSVEIIVYEKNVVGYVDYMSSHMYFDKDGIIVESTNDTLPGIPRVEGLEFGSIVLYKPLPVANNRVFNDILNLTGSLAEYGISCDNVKYDTFLNATLTIGDLEVALGQDNLMEMKISTLNDILPKLAGRKGELDLSEYKENTDRESYIFKEKKS
jgi:cell division protein FtsQ